MIHQRLAAMAADAPADAGMRENGVLLSYAELVERSARLASALLDRGIGPGDTVLLLMHNSPRIAVAVHALWAVGAIAFPLGPGATVAEAVQAGQRAKAVALFAEPELAEIAAMVAAQLGSQNPLPVYLAGDDGPRSLGELARGAMGRLPLVPDRSPALYLMSSGTTGMPKIVPHSQGELLADADRGAIAWGYTPEDRVFAMLPANFAMGLLMGLTNAALAGASVVYWRDPRPLLMARRAALDTIAGEKISVLGAVPAMFDGLAGGARPEDMASLRLAYSGGAGISRTLFEKCRDRMGLEVRQAYGSTEAIFVSFNNLEDADASWASVGAPVGDAEVRLDFSEPGLAEGVGEILVRSSSVAKGYLDSPQADAVTFVDGWVRSGDLARMDADGNLFIAGRSKLLIEVAGFKIDPIEVEYELDAHPAVAESAVAGVIEGNVRQPRLKAFVVRNDDVQADELVRHLRARLSAHKVPSLISFVDELPRAPSGKLLRQRLIDVG